MRIEELAEKHSRSILGYELIHFSEVAFPVWRTNLLLLVLEEIRLTVVEEFILKLIGVGVGNVNEISEILGIEKPIIRNAATKLLKTNVLRYKQNKQTLFLTEIGKETLELIKMMLPEQRSFSFTIDAITGKYSSIDAQNLFSHQTIKAQNVQSLFPSKSIIKPSDENIDFIELDNLLKEMNKKGQVGAPSGRLLEILNCEKVYMMYKKLRVLVFYDFNEKKYQYMVFERDHRAYEYDGILLSLDLEEHLGVLPLENILYKERNTLSEKIVTTLEEEATKNLQELEKVEKKLVQLTQDSKLDSSKTEEVGFLEESVKGLKQATRLLRRFEFRSIMESGLEDSHEWVIILDPFLSKDLYDDDMLARIDKALQRGVRLLLLYNDNTQVSTERKRVEQQILSKLKEVKEKKHGKLLFLRKLPQTNEKVLICDKKFMSIGSFSWLESETTSTKGLRLENNIYTKNRGKIIETIIEIRKLAEVGKDVINLKEYEDKKVRVFFSYSHQDEVLRNELEKHLIMLKRKGVIETWHDRKIDAGSSLDSEIDKQIQEADIILLLISVDFLTSDYCYEIEVRESLERHLKKEVVVIPIILRTCDWKSAPFSKLMALPTDAKPVTTWLDRDEAFLNIAKGIEEVAKKVKKKYE